MARYDTIGKGYAQARRADPAVARQIHDALGGAERVLNIGAGTGNYEPVDNFLAAVEPSTEMLRQRTNGNPAIQGVAEALPLRDNSFDAAMGIFTVHHWPDKEAGLLELARVSKRQVLLVYDYAVCQNFWLLEYFPEIMWLEQELDAPNTEWIAQHLNVIEVRNLLVPPDSTDGFTVAYWRRPEKYLEPAVQEGMSSLAMLDRQAREAGTNRLRDELASGAWNNKYGHLLSQETYDGGYRLVISES